MKARGGKRVQLSLKDLGTGWRNDLMELLFFLLIFPLFDLY